MKKHVSILALLLCLSMQFTAFAESPCTTGFALGYSLAIRDKARGIVHCEDSLLTGPCKEEIERRFSYTVTTLYIDFNNCCCTNGYTECCN